MRNSSGSESPRLGTTNVGHRLTQTFGDFKDKGYRVEGWKGGRMAHCVQREFRCGGVPQGPHDLRKMGKATIPCFKGNANAEVSPTVDWGGNIITMLKGGN